MNKLSIKALGMAFGLTLAFVYLACVLFMALAGEWAIIFILNCFLHGIDVTSIVRMEVPFLQTFCGFFMTFFLGGFMGVFVAAFYNTLKTER